MHLLQSGLYTQGVICVGVLLILTVAAKQQHDFPSAYQAETHFSVLYQ